MSPPSSGFTLWSIFTASWYDDVKGYLSGVVMIVFMRSNCSMERAIPDVAWWRSKIAFFMLTGQAFFTASHHAGLLATSWVLPLDSVVSR